MYFHKFIFLIIIIMTETNNLSPLEMKKQELRRKIEALNEKKENNNVTLVIPKSITDFEYLIDYNISKSVKTNEEIDYNLQDKTTISEEKQTQKTQQKTQIIIDKIILEIWVELTQEERDNWIQLCHRGFNIPIDNSIYLLFNLLISDENDFQVKFSKDAKIDCMYHQLEPSKNQNNPWYNRWKVEVRIHQDDRIKQEILPSKTKVFELLLWDYEVNYYLNNFYNYVKGQKELLESEVEYYENSILKEVLNAKKTLEMSHRMNTSKIIKILEQINSIKNVGVENDKLDNEEKKEIKNRWKERFKNWTYNLVLRKDFRVITQMNYAKNGIEVELLADTLNIWIESLRRLIKRVEKKTNKKYLFENKKWVGLVDEKWKKITNKSTKDYYNKEKWFITMEWFFDILAYVRSL